MLFTSMSYLMIFNYFKTLMKLNLAILGSTGSIGQTLLKIVSKDKENYKISLITDKNYKLS